MKGMPKLLTTVSMKNVHVKKIGASMNKISAMKKKMNCALRQDANVRKHVRLRKAEAAEEAAGNAYPKSSSFFGTRKDSSLV